MSDIRKDARMAGPRERFEDPIDAWSALRLANARRLQRWHGEASEWTGADWSNAMCGEAGEAANIVKKIRRHETGLGTSYNTPELAELRAKLGPELADVVIYCDLLANHYGIDLGEVITDKFNLVSEKNGFPERIRRNDVNPRGIIDRRDER